MTVVYRQAGLVDLEVLARLNGGLQRDEGGLRRLDDVTLRQRMADWLSSGEYQAVLAERDGHSLGYALFRLEEATIFLRHLYVAPEARRQGLGRALYRHLRDHLWPADWPVRLEVLATNKRGQAFWGALGFETFSLTLQQSPTGTH